MADNKSQRVALLWRSLGPYHMARAEAACRFLSAKGLGLVVIELSREEESREWRVDRSNKPFEIRTLSVGAQLAPGTPSMVRQLRQVLEEVSPSCIAVAGYDRPEMRYALRWGNRSGLPTILMSETKQDDRPRPWWKRRLIRHWCGWANAGLVSGSAAGEYLVAFGVPRERIFQPYGVVDNDYFMHEAERWKATGKKPQPNLPTKYFMACCRLTEARKNMRTLLQAYEEYRTQAGTEPWGLVICGDGQDRARLESFVKEHGIDGVVFTGFQQLDMLAGYYAHASCFVHPAIHEAWGLVVNEAMAAGLPVLVSRRCGCARDLVREGGNGFCFDPHSLDELTASMQRVASLSDAERTAMGMASRKQVQAWSPERFAEGLWQATEAAKDHC